jgi:hypothetical protein
VTPSDCAPTEGLDLRRDALTSAAAALLTAQEQCCYLLDLRRTCERFGYVLPYGAADVLAAKDLLKDLAGLVEAEQQRAGGDAVLLVRQA